MLSKKNAPNLFGPIFVLITQYPIVRQITVDSSTKCTTSVVPLPHRNYQKDINIYAPIAIKKNFTSGCADEIEKIENTKLMCEIHLLFPAHAKGSDINTIGARTINTWNNIKENMKVLLEDGDPEVINTRSQEKQCFVKCGRTTEDGIACGARNSIKGSAYTSVVLNTVDNNKQPLVKRDFANLYILNIDIVNSQLGKTYEPILKNGPDIEAIEKPNKPNGTRNTIYDRVLNFIDTEIVPKNSDRDIWDSKMKAIRVLS